MGNFQQIDDMDEDALLVVRQSRNVDTPSQPLLDDHRARQEVLYLTCQNPSQRMEALRLAKYQAS
jgi:hypothetical protein